MGTAQQPHTRARGAGRKIESEKRHFIEKMSLDDCKRFEDLENLFDSAAFDEEVDICSHGFTLGMLLMMEVMMKKEAMTHA